MKKKILVMGLVGIHNYGDNFITDCVQYLVNKEEKYYAIEGNLEPEMNFFTKVIYYSMILFSKILGKGSLSAKIVYYAVILRCKKYFEQLTGKIDAIILGCGSFKYGTQKLWAEYSLIIEIANKRNIPIMLNAMNIQEYKEADWRCRFLNEHASFPNVKIITTRDGEAGVKRLRENYKIREEIVCEGVGDAAFWIPECYSVKKEDCSTVIGINLIYGRIFQRYGMNLTEDDLVRIYVDLIELLDRSNIQWEFFTNGLSSDLKFGKKVLKKYGNNKIEIKIPKNQQDLLHIISGYQKILGARLHACICAYALNIPFVGFIWDKKLLDFSKMTRLDDYFVTEQDISGKELYRILSELKPNELDRNDIQSLKQQWKNKTNIYIQLFLNQI